MDNSKKTAILTIAYNEADIIRACIENWKGLVDEHLVLVSTIPWNGSPGEDDGTVDIARNKGAHVIVGKWEKEDEQRNFGLAYLYDYQYVIIVDPDELYTREDQEKILKRLKDPLDYVNKVNRNIPAFAPERLETYWKTLDYAFEPVDKHKPPIVVDPKQIKFRDKRALVRFKDGCGVEIIEKLPVTCYHLSWVKTNQKVEEKIESYSHQDVIPLNWYEDIWLKWEPGSELQIRPYGIEKSKAIYRPCPEEIKKLCQIQ